MIFESCHITLTMNTSLTHVIINTHFSSIASPKSSIQYASHKSASSHCTSTSALAQWHSTLLYKASSKTPSLLCTHQIWDFPATAPAINSITDLHKYGKYHCVGDYGDTRLSLVNSLIVQVSKHSVHHYTGSLYCCWTWHYFRHTK